MLPPEVLECIVEDVAKDYKPHEERLRVLDHQRFETVDLLPKIISKPESTNAIHMSEAATSNRLFGQKNIGTNATTATRSRI
jgi:hypothetical protein